MSEKPRVFVVGVGNIFLGDDAFGVEVVKKLATMPLPEGVQVTDFGIRGIHLAFQLLEGYETVILVDAVPRGEPPGTVYVIEAETEVEGGGLFDAHTMNPQNVLAMLTDLGGHIDRLLIVGCEPADVGEGMGLSEPVAQAVDQAVGLVSEIIEEELAYAGRER